MSHGETAAAKCVYSCGHSRQAAKSLADIIVEGNTSFPALAEEPIAAVSLGQRFCLLAQAAGIPE